MVGILPGFHAGNLLCVSPHYYKGNFNRFAEDGVEVTNGLPEAHSY